MTVEEILTDADHRMDQALDAMKHDFSTYRTGRASPVLLERIMVDYYGVETPVSQVGNVSTPEARQLMITPYDKNLMSVIERAILKSDLGINPTNDGVNIRLIFPPMTEERRKEMVKQVNARTEQGCVAVRNVRHHAMEHIKAAKDRKEITEDEQKSLEQRVQKLTDGHVAKAHELQKKKDAELMEV